MARINTRSPSWGYDDPRPEPHSMLTCRICGNTPGRSIAQPCPPTISWLFSSVLLRTSIYYRAGSSPAISWPIKFEPRGVLILKPYVFVTLLSRDILPVSISLFLTKMERKKIVFFSVNSPNSSWFHPAETTFHLCSNCQFNWKKRSLSRCQL